MINIIALISWSVLAVVWFLKPKEKTMPNWYLGIIAMNFVLINLIELLDK